PNARRVRPRVICGDIRSNWLRFSSSPATANVSCRTAVYAARPLVHGAFKEIHDLRTMPRVSRRAVLIGSASLAASPALDAVAASPYVDVVVVGAGAAGIAAGRRLAAAGRRFVIVEGNDRVGGRCLTDTRTFGVPYDRGAHWIHTPDINPVAKLAGT